MSRTIAAGIDIGTFEVKVVIAEESAEGGRLSPRMVGRGRVASGGMREGSILNASETSRSVRQALDQAEKMAGVRVKRAFVSVGGAGLSGISSIGHAIISRADLEVTERDVALALESAELAVSKAELRNRKIINTIPVEFKLDGKPVFGRIEGMKAQKIEVRVLFITCLEHHIEDLVAAVEEAGVEVIDVSPVPLAASFVTLSKKQKRAGVCLACFGGETFSMIVFEDSTPVSLEVLPFGSQILTENLALGLKISLEEAEQAKLGVLTKASVSKKRLDSIMSACLVELFDHVSAHLKKIDREQLLPAGIVFTGGGASLHGLKEAAEDELALPATIASVRFGADEKLAHDNTWSVAYGLCILAFNADGEQSIAGTAPLTTITTGGRRGLRAMSRWLSQFLP